MTRVLKFARSVALSMALLAPTALPVWGQLIEPPEISSFDDSAGRNPVRRPTINAWIGNQVGNRFEAHANPVQLLPPIDVPSRPQMSSSTRRLNAARFRCRPDIPPTLRGAWLKSSAASNGPVFRGNISDAGRARVSNGLGDNAQSPPGFAPPNTAPNSVVLSLADSLVHPAPSRPKIDMPTEHNSHDNEDIPPLAEELWLHGGSYLYEPEGDRLNWPSDESDAHYDLLRLPEDWKKPRPLTAFQEFLGADPIQPRPGLQWFGEDGFQWEPRFVGTGSYEVFGIVVEDGNRRTDGVGHQALVDLDLRLTGTERLHVQFRPLGEKNSGGSFYQFSNPEGYQDNATGIPERYWFEGEVFSIFSSLFDDEFTPRDYHFVVGKFPFVLHNNLLMNDDIIGFAVNKNTLLIDPLSNLNVQLFYGFDDVDGFQGAHVDVAGLHATADYQNSLLEATYASAHNTRESDLDAHYTAFSATRFFGPLALAGRVLLKWEDVGSRGDGQLYVLESNLHRVFSHEFECATGIEHAVFYGNAFKATSGWNSISGGNFDRLRSTFEVNPLVQLSRGARVDDTAGISLGVQLFRHEEDESILPEFVWEETGGTGIWGGGVTYLRKIGPRTFIQLRAVWTFSSDPALQRKGIFASTSFIL